MAEAERQLSDDDILRLGIEAGTAINASEVVDADKQEEIKTFLGMRAVELAHSPQTVPEED